ncbi:ABC transporter permease [Oceanidesulfovibrio marinus]|uniref:ABC transporter permease n=1 Tax=Oceanidesulfovibrio marinus TaxID=370038 RepID=A0A6P1ZGD3_9BACT|nr:ABC transporter permease [Oceanidesulfovibrio marinus]QJT10709.1 ABC transporter permease [Oceanidesulfovibrio marinus]TVM34064.1 ABC transporter permease [Oceanidesulfovibrio marinus]
MTAATQTSAQNAGRRLSPNTSRALFALGFAALFALVSGGVIFACYGKNPFEAYWLMAQGAFGSWYSLTEVLVKAAPFTYTGLAVALAATMQLWNIGCEGQLVMGGVFATGTALFIVPESPALVALPAVIIAGALGGALWALVPAVLKVTSRVSEILSTLLLNYVAIIFMEHLFYGPWRDPAGMGFPGTAMISEAAQLPRLFGTRLHPGLIGALFFALLLYWVMSRSAWGYRVRTAGKGPQAARYAGFDSGRLTLTAMAVSGALAGLAGMAEITGLHHRLQAGLAIGYGYDGIIVAFLARLNPLAVPVAAVALGGLMVGGEQLQSRLGLPASISMALEAALLFGVLGGEALARWRERRNALRAAAVGNEDSPAGSTTDTQDGSQEDRNVR